MRRSVLTATLILLPCLSSPAAAQRLTPEDRGAAAQPALNISGKIGKKSVESSGSGTCRHAPDAAIRGVSASLWMVQFQSAGEAPLSQLNLTLWRPKDGGSDQLSLAMETSSGSYRIETDGGGEKQGQGSVVILRNGPGGRLEITGKADGKPLQLTIDCPAFTGVQAEGG